LRDFSKNGQIGGDEVYLSCVYVHRFHRYRQAVAQAQLAA
jgi:hypothetical protein